NRAYNDRSGVTADFNINLLSRIRSEMDCDINPDIFSHSAFYNPALNRIEMHLKAEHEHSFDLAGHKINLRQNETIHTENSYKYNLDMISELLAKSGYDLIQQWQDKNGYFALLYLKAKKTI
ncbi:MAG: L-histidine N(alpha)-methyltransferase, partial [Gammaproteobacteria bacterium]|nr:L-histidine N(alpha)-methyltransferase [Gammaproteobacteria bacterium]